jgi:carboxypeptidase Taq
MTENLDLNYKRLMKKVKDIMIFNSVQSIIQWDMETKMPPKGINLRSQQLALLSQINHKMNTNPEIGRLIKIIEHHSDYETLDEIKKRNVHLIKKSYNEKTKLPEKLVKKIAKQKAITVNVWKRAKKNKNFSMFKPDFEKLINLQKEVAEILMKVKKTETPYDALLDIFEPKMTAKTIAQVFNKLKNGIISILKKCETSKQPDLSIIKYKVPVEVQQKIAVALAETVQYDVTSNNAGGRIDETEHPFTNGYYDDVRITTHYYAEKFLSSIFSVLHEAGHALYEQNLNQKWIYQPIGTSCSMGFHESQSRFVENIVGRSEEFWYYFLPQFKTITGTSFSNLELNNFIRAINKVKASKIRVEADEVTYGLHIIIRFNIERDLFADKISIGELPEIWNQKYNDYLNIKIENDSEGVMQDTHWASGYYGYFPSYALGNIYSGQLLETVNNKIPLWRTDLKRGNLQKVFHWLAMNVHKQGNLYDPPVLIKKVTGKELNVEPYLTYLSDKYSKLYEF